MMKRKRTKFAALLLAAASLTGLASGCGSPAAESQAPSSAAAQTGSAQEASSAGEEKDGPSWTWDTSPVELSMFVVEGGYSNDWNTEKYAYFRKVTEETGLSFTFTSGDENKLNAIIASQNLPDLFSMWTGYAQRRTLEDGDKLYPIEDLIEQYAPTFTSLPQSMLDWYRNENTGKTYAMANYFFAEEWMTDGTILTVHNRITARGDLMEQAGLTAEDFETKEGFKAALRTFKDSGITYNGFAVSPFMLGAATTAQSIEYWAEDFGAAREDGETGDWLDIRMQPEMKEGLLFLNDLYTSGLLDIECLTIDNTQLREKVASGATFVTTGYAGSSAPATTSLLTADPNASIVPVGPIHGDSGRELQVAAGGQGWQAVVITKDCEHPDRAIRFMEYLYDEHNMLEANYGMEDVVWIMGEDGRIVYTDEYLAAKEADPVNVATTYGFGGNALMFSLQDMLMSKYLPEPTDPIDQANRKMDIYWSSYGYAGLAFSELESALDTETATLSAKLADIWNQAIASVITAPDQDAAAAAYDTAVANMKAEGWETYYEAVNTEFRNRKAKLGIEFAHPYNQ